MPLIAVYSPKGGTGNNTGGKPRHSLSTMGFKLWRWILIHKMHCACSLHFLADTSGCVASASESAMSKHLLSLRIMSFNVALWQDDDSNNVLRLR